MFFTEAEIDRGIFEALRKALVTAGYLPDAATITTPVAWETAKNTIIASGKEIIEVMGVGTWKAKDALKTNRIVIEQSIQSPSDTPLGGTLTEPVKNTSQDIISYNEYTLPAKATDIDYMISLIASGTNYRRIATGLIYKALGSSIGKVLKGCRQDGTPTDNDFIIDLTNKQDVSGEGFFEIKFMYRVRNVVTEDLQPKSVPLMNEIDGELFDSQALPEKLLKNLNIN